MAAPGLVWLLAGACLAGFVSAAEDCLWYYDEDGLRHPGFPCPFTSFCCGDCHYRHCCDVREQLLTEEMQRDCIPFMNPKGSGLITSYTSLFILLLAIVISCFMCSCCYLYGRREPRRTPYQAQDMQMAYPLQANYPRQAMYPADPRPQLGLATMPGYPPTCSSVQYPLCSPGPPKCNPPSPPPYVSQKR